MRHFRASYRTLARRTDLPPCPTSAVTMNRAKRKRQPITWDGLPAWREAVEAIGNPIRRDFQFFVLFTGLRSLDARTVRFEDVDFERGTIHRPCPKGGSDRAFTLPVSDFVLGILRRRREENHELYPDDEGWVFPTRDAKGRVTHVQEAKEQRYADGRKVAHLPSPHRLRDTFASAAHEAGVDWFSLKTLMNHTLSNSGDVTAGYVRPDGEHLRGCAERISAFFVERLWPKGYALVPAARTSAG
jgi:integrase